jgi:hypothetical protein
MRFFTTRTFFVVRGDTVVRPRAFMTECIINADAVVVGRAQRYATTCMRWCYDRIFLCHIWWNTMFCETETARLLSPRMKVVYVLRFISIFFLYD